MAGPHQVPYFCSLGAFIHTFALVEGTLQAALMMHARVNENTAKAVFSGVRIDTANSFIKRIYQSHEEKIEPWFDDALSQLADINAARNSIVHFGATFEEGEIPIVSNASKALTPENARYFPVSSEILRKMTSDLLVISQRLLASVYPIAFDGEQLPSRYVEAIATPWQYKHAPQAGNRRTLRDPFQEQQGPPGSSQE